MHPSSDQVHIFCSLFTAQAVSLLSLHSAPVSAFLCVCVCVRVRLNSSSRLKDHSSHLCVAVYVQISILSESHLPCHACGLGSASNISSYLGRMAGGNQVRTWESKSMHSTHHQPPLGVTQELVIGYEFEVSEDLTLHWLMTVFSGRQA